MPNFENFKIGDVVQYDGTDTIGKIISLYEESDEDGDDTIYAEIEGWGDGWYDDGLFRKINRKPVETKLLGFIFTAKNNKPMETVITKL